jgi:CCR4-NOT transcriptional regulation complex NOT5 subunit
MPSESTSTYEKGDYVYFDPTQGADTSWVLRIKKDFKVEYSMVASDAWYEAYSVMTKS